jgi:nicotinate-nucleotide adenylyltransferase
MTRYTVYGGSFDPIHVGHLSMIERAVALDYEVIVVPAYRHAFGKQSAPFEHRARMCELALQERGGGARARVCRIESRLSQDSTVPVYTYDVLSALRDALSSAPSLLVGPDIEAEWRRWYKHEAIDREFGRLCLPVRQDIRSTSIRQRLYDGESPVALHGLVPEAVIAYIVAEGLYQSC